MDFGSIRNYYERLVFQEVQKQVKGKPKKAGYTEDVACIALNHLPPRYYRHDVDLFFYLSPTERKEIENKVQKAVEAAIKYIAEKTT